MTRIVKNLFLMFIIEAFSDSLQCLMKIIITLTHVLPSFTKVDDLFSLS